jgi:D-sedoheptulose 7-phosphate isomerase
VSGDIFIGISTSGNSPNILAAIGAAKEKGVKTVGLAGSGGAIQDVCDHCISVPSTSTPTIQESHIMIGHIICAYVEKAYFSSERQE